MSKRLGTPRCSFCGREQSPGRHIVVGPDVSICEECVGVCGSLLNEQKAAARPDAPVAVKLQKPHAIKEYLDQYVVGQEHTKKVLAVAVHNHYKRIQQAKNFEKGHPLGDVEIEKSNILLVGPTGSGKTLLAKTLARCLDVPFSISDATTLTEAGYVGEDVENILLRLIQAADNSVARAEIGIIYIDEIDKIAKRTDNVSITRDVSGEGVQQGLLKILEGTVASVPPQGGRKHPEQSYIRINTGNILFICGGAFVGLDEFVRRRHRQAIVGFSTGNPSILKPGYDSRKGGALDIAPEDLMKFGMIPEFVGRLPVVASLMPLSEDDLIKVLVEPKNSMVSQYQKLLAMEGVALSFSDSSLRALAKAAAKKGTGARGLRAELEDLMLDVMYEAPRHEGLRELHITRSMVEKRRVSFSSARKTAKSA